MRTNRILKATVALLLAGAAMGPMAMAWACTSLATIDLTPAARNSGEQVTGKGYGFSSAKRAWSGGLASPVEIRLQRADGPLLASVRPSRDGTINFTFTAPEGAPGYYTVIASQSMEDGRPVAGTPARTTLALNNPPPLAKDGAGNAATSDVRTGGQAPDGIVHIQAPGAVALPDAPVAKAPAQVLPPISPEGSRSRDILSAASRGSDGGQLGLSMAVLGGLGLIGAAGAAMFVRRNESSQRI